MMATPLHIAKAFIDRCEGGFENHFEWMAWRKKHAKEIEALPIGLRNQVLMAWEQASTPEFSRVQRKTP